MRLTCPRCNARYEIPDAAIPAMGREVECSACANVWHQPKAGPPQNAKEIQKIPAPQQDYDASARPTLHQPLHDSVLSILREEAARELSARRPADPGAAPAQDHIPATSASDNAKVTATTTGVDVAPGNTTIIAPQDFDWPVATVILPGDPLPADDATPGAKDLDKAPAMETLAPVPQAAPAAPERPDEPTLPDAASLAATLTRPGPAPLRPAALDSQAAPVETLTDPDPAEPVPASPVHLPAIFTPQARRGGYATGFGLAVMLALALLAFYALAPRIAPDAEWRLALDQARLWLDTQFAALRGLIFG